MRTAAALGGLGVLAFLVTVLAWPTQPSGPEPILHGRDVCAHCRMHIGQPGFAGEMRDERGALTKYDDVGCLVEAMLRTPGRIPEAWVEDHATGRLIPLLAASLVRGERSRTPMGSGLLAFADDAAARTLVQANGAELVRLEDLVHARGRHASQETP